MDKFELDLDDLEVDSFQTNSEKEDEEGTVHGYSLSFALCEPCIEDDFTEWNTCGNCDIYMA